MRDLARLGLSFFGGTLLAGSIVISLDIFLVGYFSQHSNSALLTIELAAVLLDSLIGTILFMIGLSFQRSQVAGNGKRSMILAFICGLSYSVLLALYGPGGLIRADKRSELGSLALFSLWLIPIGLAFLMRLRGNKVAGNHD